MPGLLQKGRKRPSVNISDDEDEQSGYTSAASTSSKRARYAHHASSRPSPTPAQDKTNGEDAFQPGSLVRVKLKNFVTYTAAEFHLGPSLNMIIGPNGTGKSTLVCAICLGLGWGSEHLGRAKEIGEYVKHGATEAHIEIELAAGPDDATNPIIRRLIRKEDNKSQYWINGKSCSQKVVTTKARGYAIQIDNLCQFLPQDRVVEFARMSDVDRLRETQRAAAPPQMVEWHDQLKDLRKTEKDLETKHKNEEAHLKSLENAQNRARDDVERFHQREGLVRKAKCLKKVRPIIEMRLVKADYQNTKAEYRAAARELDQLNLEVEPIREAQVEIESYRDEISGIVARRKDLVQATKTQADQMVKKMDDAKEKVAKCTEEAEAELKSKKDRERDIARIQNDMKNLEQRRRQEPVAYEPEQFEQRKAEIRSKMSDATSREVELNNLSAEIRAKAHDLNVQDRAKRAQRQQLDTQTGKKTHMLKESSKETAEAWDWFQQNRDKLSLQGEVYGPPLLTCSVPDAQYAQAVESQLKKGEYLAITCTNVNDMNNLSNKLLKPRDKGGLGLHDIFLRSVSKPLSDFQAPISHEEMQQYGLEGTLLSHIEGPEPVLAMLCDNRGLHRVGYARKPISDDQYEQISRSRMQTWISGDLSYRMTTRREYGASSMSVTTMKPAHFFVDQPANAEEIRQLEETIQENKREAAEMQENFNRLKEDLKNVKQEITDLKEERDQVQAEQAQLQKAVAEWEALPRKIAQKQGDLDALIEDNAQTNSRVKAIKKKGQTTSLQIAELTLAYVKLVLRLRSQHESLVEAEIRLIEAKSEFNALKADNREILQRLQAKEAEKDQLHQRHQQLREQYARMHRILQNDVNGLNDEEKAIVGEYSNLESLEALEQEMQAVDARLEMMAEGNPGAIRAYENREEEIKKTEKLLDTHAANLSETKEEIAEIRQEWEPQLDALIRQISDAFAYNFQQIGCAGEVEVYKDEEDFDNWSIQISVRFREGEPLSILNSHRQSGGERAVSTIFYLMALQDLAQSPFRVVDEINQGMDPRNERMVHERMVNIACQERTSQYFLVTPKLLPGLKFHPRMKVHVINSGEHIPDAQSVQGGWDLSAMARLALRSRKGVEVA